VIRHFLSEGFSLLRERPVVSAGLTIAISVALSLGGLSLAVALWAHPLLARGARSVPVAVLLRPQVRGQTLTRWLEATEKAHPRWRLRVVPHDEIARRLGERFPYLQGLLEEEGEDLLPPMLEVTAPHPASVRSLEKSPAVLAVGPVSTIQETLSGLSHRMEALLAAATAALLAVAFLMASIWVHLELYRHGDEIAIMRLVGATEGSIRGPYLVSAAVPGLAAGLAAAAATGAGAAWLSRLTSAVGLPPLSTPWWLLAGLVVFGLAVPLGAAAWTLARHAHMGTEEL